MNLNDLKKKASWAGYSFSDRRGPARYNEFKQDLESQGFEISKDFDQMVKTPQQIKSLVKRNFVSKDGKILDLSSMVSNNKTSSKWSASIQNNQIPYVIHSSNKEPISLTDFLNLKRLRVRKTGGVHSDLKEGNFFIVLMCLAKILPSAGAQSPVTLEELRKAILKPEFTNKIPEIKAQLKTQMAGNKAFFENLVDTVISEILEPSKNDLEVAIKQSNNFLNTLKNNGANITLKDLGEYFILHESNPVLKSIKAKCGAIMNTNGNKWNHVDVLFVKNLSHPILKGVSSASDFENYNIQWDKAVNESQIIPVSLKTYDGDYMGSLSLNRHLNNVDGGTYPTFEETYDENTKGEFKQQEFQRVKSEIISGIESLLSKWDSITTCEFRIKNKKVSKVDALKYLDSEDFKSMVYHKSMNWSSVYGRVPMWLAQAPITDIQKLISISAGVSQQGTSYYVVSGDSFYKVNGSHTKVDIVGIVLTINTSSIWLNFDLTTFKDGKEETSKKSVEIRCKGSKVPFLNIKNGHY